MGFNLNYLTTMSAVFMCFNWGKYGRLRKTSFFWSDMAGLEKYCTGEYRRIGVYRDNYLRLNFVRNRSSIWTWVVF